MTEDVREICEKTMENALLLNERTNRLASEYGGEQVEDTMIQVVEEMLKNCTDKIRYRRIAGIAVSMGERLNSQKLADVGKQHLAAWEAKFNDANAEA